MTTLDVQLGVGARYAWILDDRSVCQLTNLLALPPRYGTARPSAKWLRLQTEMIKRLRSTLLRPKLVLQRLAVKVTEAVPIAGLPPAAILCPVHKKLHPWIIRALFNLLVSEVTLRCERLQTYRDGDGDGGGDGDGSHVRKRAETVRKVLDRLHSVNALWLSKQAFRMVFGRLPEHGEHVRLVEVVGGCEACVLSCIGSRGELLADLRANMLARATREGPRLLKFVDSWIDCFDGESAKRIREHSEAMGKELGKARRFLSRMRKERLLKHEQNIDEHRKRRAKKRNVAFEGTDALPGDLRDASSRRTHSARDTDPETLHHGQDASQPSSSREKVANRNLPSEAERLGMHIADYYARSQVSLADVQSLQKAMHPAFRTFSPAPPQPLKLNRKQEQDPTINVEEAAWETVSDQTRASSSSPNSLPSPTAPGEGPARPRGMGPLRLHRDLAPNTPPSGGPRSRSAAQRSPRNASRHTDRDNGHIQQREEGTTARKVKKPGGFGSGNSSVGSRPREVALGSHPDPPQPSIRQGYDSPPDGAQAVVASVFYPPSSSYGTTNEIYLPPPSTPPNVERRAIVEHEQNVEEVYIGCTLREVGNGWDSEVSIVRDPWGWEGSDPQKDHGERREK